MGQEKSIGQIIKKARENKGISQNELAKILHVTRQAVSNWENNHNLPDSYILVNLCQILDLNLNIFLNDINFEEVIYEEKKKVKKIDLKIIITLLILIVLVVLLLLTIIKRSRFSVYDIDIESDDIKLENGIFIKSNTKNYFQLGNIILTNDNLKIENIISIKIISKNEDEENLIFKCSYNNEIKFSDNYGYNAFAMDDIDINNIFIIIKFYNEESQNFDEYNYKMIFNEQFKSNKLWYFKNNAMAENESKVDSTEIILPHSKLIEYGYKYDKDKNNYIKKDNDIIFTYDANNERDIYLNYNQIYITYDMKRDNLYIYSDKDSYYIYDDIVKCVSNCGDYHKYDKFINLLKEEVKLLKS